MRKGALTIVILREERKIDRLFLESKEFSRLPDEMASSPKHPSSMMNLTLPYLIDERVTYRDKEGQKERRRRIAPSSSQGKMEMELTLPIFKEPIQPLHQGLNRKLATEAAAPHPVQAFQVTVSMLADRRRMGVL